LANSNSHVFETFFKIFFLVITFPFTMVWWSCL
jgi:hypothetical protein